DYAVWKQAGVLTFRSGPMRQNAAYSTVDVQNKTLTQVWSQPVGSMKINKATAYGVVAPGQPVIVKWPTEVRQRMGINDAAKETTALKEVIVGAQDGKIYFYNLLNGEATRDPIELGAPSAGGLSVATNGTPVLGVGQNYSRLASKTVKNGYHLINLLNNSKAKLIACDGKDKNSNYTGVTGAALFDSASGTMVFGSQNGVLYTVELGELKETYDYQSGKLNLSTSTQGYKTVATKQKKTNTNIDASVAAYNNYVYYGDQGGIMQCVDINTLTPVWAVNTGDNIDATPALDAEDESTVALYTGNTILNQGKKGVCTIRRLNALTGAEDWSYVVPELAYTTEYEIGCEASPVVGQNAISDLVIFTVTKGAAGADVIALNKKSGTVAWQSALTASAVSSPVAVYNENGDAWIIQAQSDGSIHLMDGKSGEIVNTLKLDGEITASPAVYGNLLVIGTTGKDTGAVYCIKID
ncbi:MAG: PQQ-binding-like beta-propeller repeat protein, partial [Clostridia bacterium]